MDAMKRVEERQYYDINHWDKVENGVLERRVWSNNYGERFPKHIQQLLDKAYCQGFEEGQSSVRRAIRVAMGEA